MPTHGIRLKAYILNSTYCIHFKFDLMPTHGFRPNANTVIRPNAAPPEIYNFSISLDNLFYAVRKAI